MTKTFVRIVLCKCGLCPDCSGCECHVIKLMETQKQEKHVKQAIQGYVPTTGPKTRSGKRKKDIPSPYTEMIDTRHRDLICPITRHLMYDPVAGSDGYIYEKSAIVNWLIDNNKSPITREVMSKEVHPVRYIKEKIEELMILHPEYQRFQNKKNYKKHKEDIKKHIENEQHQELYRYTDFCLLDRDFGENNNDYLLKVIIQLDDRIFEYVVDRAVDLEGKQDDNSNGDDCDGDDSDDEDGEYTYPLILACQFGKLHHIRYLVEKKNVTVTAADSRGWTGLHRACNANTLDIVKYLAGVLDIEKENNAKSRPMHEACLNSSDICRHIASLGANLLAEDDDDDTPLDICFSLRDKSTILYILYNTIIQAIKTKQITKVTDKYLKNIGSLDQNKHLSKKEKRDMVSIVLNIYDLVTSGKHVALLQKLKPT